MSASTLKTYAVTCDRCGMVRSGQSEKLLTFRQMLKALGWRVAKFNGRHYNLDVCPRCQS